MGGWVRGHDAAALGFGCERMKEAHRTCQMLLRDASLFAVSEPPRERVQPANVLGHGNRILCDMILKARDEPYLKVGGVPSPKRLIGEPATGRSSRRAQRVVHHLLQLVASELAADIEWRTGFDQSPQEGVNGRRFNDRVIRWRLVHRKRSATLRGHFGPPCLTAAPNPDEAAVLEGSGRLPMTETLKDACRRSFVDPAQDLLLLSGERLPG